MKLAVPLEYEEFDRHLVRDSRSIRLSREHALFLPGRIDDVELMDWFLELPPRAGWMAPRPTKRDR
jgi:hypothetical protein